MLSKRQATGGFIGAAGPVNPASCSDATLFNLTNGQLTSGGEAVATDPGVAYIELRVMPAGTISTTFSISGGVLHWFNAAFTNGQATFCQVPTGQVYAVFVPLANGPVGCTQVSLLAFSAVQCQNGAVVPVPSSSVASGPGTVTVTQPSGVGPTAVVTATVIGSNNLPQHQNIFPVAASPAGESCVPITLSWVPGVMPTFIGLP
ncbi:hypothetical protein BJ170DRAFT_636763 [Xylariales sp. AK1849]|nr:hypothetical protein BJ170DRAFT_636763 [Xylariales sp. AK1849]